MYFYLIGCGGYEGSTQYTLYHKKCFSDADLDAILIEECLKVLEDTYRVACDDFVRGKINIPVRGGVRSLCRRCFYKKPLYDIHIEKRRRYKGEKKERISFKTWFQDIYQNAIAGMIKNHGFGILEHEAQAWGNEFTNIHEEETSRHGRSGEFEHALCSLVRDKLKKYIERIEKVINDSGNVGSRSRAEVYIEPLNLDGNFEPIVYDYYDE